MTSLSVEAKCPHGNEPPSPHCQCGVHYVPDVHAFCHFPWIAPLLKDADTRTPSRIAITFGAAVGGIANDFDPGVDCQRTKRYHVLSIVIPKCHAAQRDSLRQQYKCPVSVGISPQDLHDAAKHVPDRGPDWFFELAAIPSAAEDEPTQNYNAMMRKLTQAGALRQICGPAREGAYLPG